MNLQCVMAEKIKTTHVLMDKELVVYRRERSNIWQCRFKVDGVWQRATTKESKLPAAKVKAKELMIEAEIRKRSNLPVVTRRFRDIAKLAIERMDKEEASGKGKVSFKDYKKVISDYLIPCLGNKNITNIDYAALDELDAWRLEKMGKEPTHSTMQTHNAALNRVFDEAVIRNFLTEANRPKLEAKGRVSARRAAFDMDEVRALIAGFDGWIERAKNADIKESRLLMRDYVIVLLDTGARPGKELLQLKWKQIDTSKKPVVKPTNQYDEEGELIETANLNRSVSMPVTGKTGTRLIVGMKATADALKAIGERNYDVKMPLLNPLENLIKPTNDDYVFRKRDKTDVSSSFQKMFARYLEEHNLLVDPKTEQKRVFYSLRHSYATFALERDKTPHHTLAKQMGTSIGMIEKHYSHLNVLNAIEQLRGEESRKMISAAGVIDAEYTYNKTAEKKKVKKK